jgi:hypothetical protein
MRVRPITPREARRSILEKVSRSVDRARQVATKTGLRSRRVFLVWSQWSGAAVGDGDEVELSRMELLPTPRVRGLDGVTFSSYGAGVLPEGSLRVDLVSVQYTEDQLRGHVVPPSSACLTPLVWNPPPPNGTFFYEVVEDGRGDRLPIRQRYRLLGQPDRKEGRVCWGFALERASEDNTREGPSRFAPGGTYG